jgi:hypothetical protein
MTKKIIYSLLLVIGISQFSSAQFGFSHEVGAFVGPVAFQSDFGERHDLSTNAGNTGFGVGLVHYMNFSYRAECNCYTPETYFNDHFKLRTELSFTKTKLDHFGEWAEKESLGGAQLRAMDGEAKVTDIGMHLNYSMKLEMMNMLFNIAYADGEVVTSELNVIQRIANIFRITQSDFDSVRALYMKNVDADWAYKALEIEPSASNDEIKKAYRKMAMKHHPDKVHELGEDVKKSATEKFRAISEAYESLKKQRGMN